MNYKIITVDYDAKEVEVVIGDFDKEYIGNAICTVEDKFDEKTGVQLANARAELPYNINVLKEVTDDLLSDKDTELVASELRELDKIARRIRLNIKHITQHTRGIRRKYGR